MNCFIGTSNGSVENIIVDDENTTVIRISLCVNRASYYDCQVVTNTRDLIQFNSQHYAFTRLFFPDRTYQRSDGWQDYEIVKHSSMIQFKFNFYDINALGHWLGGIGVLDSKSARTVLEDFFHAVHWEIQYKIQLQKFGILKLYKLLIYMQTLHLTMKA